MDNLASTYPDTAVLLLAHGSPESAEDVPEFLLKVTGGRGLPTDVVEEIEARYRLIGKSPLTDLTMRQAELLSQKIGLPVYVGMRNWRPFIADVLREMASDSVSHAVVICLAPQNSRTSVGLYRSALGTDNPFSIDFIESWHAHPFLIRAFAEKLRDGLAKAGAEARHRLPIIFTAHSVPERTITDGDPYERQAKETAALVADVAALPSKEWQFAFQSQGASGGPWIGPTVEETILSLKSEGHDGVFIQPIGFLCDHVEVLYDIDISFKKFAQAQSMRLWRAESLNGSSFLTEALAELVLSRLRRSNALDPVVRTAS